MNKKKIIITIVVLGLFTSLGFVVIKKDKPMPKLMPPTFEPSDKIIYKNASLDIIQVSLPYPGAVTGKEFSVLGKARGNWFFEASFPIEVLDKDGKQLAVGIAQAQGEWMTTEFVPFKADIKVPPSYIGPATLVLHKDNPSGLPEHEASISFPFTIEY